MNEYRVKSEQIVDGTIQLFEKDLNNEMDVLTLIEKSLEINPQLLEDISFTSKYCIGLMTIIKDNSIEVKQDYKESIQQDFTEAVQKVKDILLVIISTLEPNTKKSFEECYLQLTQVSFAKLYSLIEDFAKIKIYLNSIKRKV
ncbi:MAG: hypothetical protein N3A61_01220 [Ignavibacteria bacterium]|nr:hypothetical protein [Ignavibacteria bacterium]